MSTEYVALPGALLEKIRQTAADEKITPEELVLDAVENRLSRSEWRKTLEFGELNARRRGLRVEDVEFEIARARSERS